MLEHNSNMPYADREKRLEYHRNYYHSNAEYLKEEAKKYRRKYPEKYKNQQKIYREANKELVKQSKKKEYQKHKIRYRELHKEWIKNNKEKNLEYMRQYNKKRRREDPNYRIGCLLRSRILECFKEYTKTGKKFRASKYGIDLNKIVEQLMINYKKGYTIDHIAPIKLFNLEDEEEIKIVFHPLNHRWITKKENSSKKDKLTKEGINIIKHIIKIEKIEPIYIDVILERFSKFTGLDPVREDGVKWSELKGA